MEMTYDGTLVMPSSYAVMDEDEMMYLEGGYGFSMARGTVQKVLDVAILLVTAGLSASASVGKFAAKIGWDKLKDLVKKAIIKLGISTYWAGKAVGVLSIVTGFSIGGGIAYVLDRTDRSGLNGYVQY